MQEERSKQDRQCGREELEGLMEEVFGGEVHAQRLASLTDGVDGVLHAASLGVRAIGQGLAVAQGLAPRHAIKQVDRLLSNPKLRWGLDHRIGHARLFEVDSAAQAPTLLRPKSP